jgi:transcriptional regulator NrdR family protein
MDGITINRRGTDQEFDERKVYASCYSACLFAKRKKEEAEDICDKVTKRINDFVVDVSENKTVTSDEIFKKTTECMNEVDRESAMIYESNRGNL